MNTGLWLARRQVRWMIVLLALLPLVPTALMVRLMLQNAERDRDFAVTEITEVYRQQLSLFLERYSIRAEETSVSELADYLQRIFGDEVALSIRNPEGTEVFATELVCTDDAVQVQVVTGRYQDWYVNLDGVAAFPIEIQEQIRESLWQAGLIVVGVIAVAGGVWFAVHRGLRLDELRSDLVTTVSHEMKTPVASMKVLLDTLNEGGDEVSEETQRDYIGLLSRENERLERLASNFLTFSRLEKGDLPLKIESLNVRSEVGDVFELLAPQIVSRNGNVEITVDPSVFVTGDRDAFSILIGNLIENGLKYGGDPTRIVVSGHVEGSRVEISVTDNGKGISEDKQKQVFRAFVQSDQLLSQGSSGVGLGLAICQGLARRMKGRIRIQSEGEGKGTSFVVSLPTGRSFDLPTV